MSYAGGIPDRPPFVTSARSIVATVKPASGIRTVERARFEAKGWSVKGGTPGRRAWEGCKIIEFGSGAAGGADEGEHVQWRARAGSAAGQAIGPDGCPVPLTIDLKGVNFDFDKDTLRPDAVAILDEAVSILGKYPQLRVEVAGHTDSIGTEQYNQGLSERRAKAVYDYLTGHGVDAGRLVGPNGFGETGSPTNAVIYAQPYRELEIIALAKAYVETDSSLLEINPLMITESGDVLALDAVATRGGAHQEAVLVRQRDRQPVDLGLGHDLDRDRRIVAQPLDEVAHAGEEIPHVIVVERVL